jgi:predicted nucleotidyltransferase
MNAVEDLLRRAAADLRAAGARYCLVGGLAVSVRSAPRFTKDVDLAVAVHGDAEAEALVAGLRGSGYNATASVEQEARGRMAQVRLTPARGEGEGVVVDLLFASSGIEEEIVAAAEPVEVLPGLVIPVATAGHLVAMKILSRDDETRPQDAVDLRALLRVAGPRDLEEAGKALALVESRGFARGRNLGRDFERVRRT